MGRICHMLFCTGCPIYTARWAAGSNTLSLIIGLICFHSAALTAPGSYYGTERLKETVCACASLCVFARVLPRVWQRKKKAELVLQSSAFKWTWRTYFVLVSKKKSSATQKLSNVAYIIYWMCDLGIHVCSTFGCCCIVCESCTPSPYAGTSGRGRSWERWFF